MHSDPVTTLKTIVEQELAGSNLYLVDVELKGDQRNRVIWIYVESIEGGVSVDKCAEMSRNVGSVLEEQQVFKGGYRINVSSPGIDKPLVDKRQYYTNRGRKCNVRYSVGETETEVEGTLKRVEDRHIYIDDGKEEHRILFEDILETRILVEF